MIALPRSIDFSKIKGPYSLLGLFLFVIEGFFGYYWLSRAESTGEREFAGVLMTLIFILFLVVVVYIRNGVSSPIVPQELHSKVTPAEEEVTQEQVESPGPLTIAAPDGSYLIEEPPKDWTVRELTYDGWINESWGITVTDPSRKTKSRGTSHQAKEILTLQSNKEISVIPIPGKTTIDGRRIPTALETKISTKLAILPMDRMQPPLYVDRPLTHNVSSAIGQLLNVNILTLQSISSGTIPNIHKQYLLAEFQQEIENAIVNGKEGKNIKNNITVIGIEGELRDHLLIMTYPSLLAVDAPYLEMDLQTLQSLVNSFRPLRVLNPDEKRKEIKNIADQKFKELMMVSGKDFFKAEFNLLLLRLKDWDMNDPEKCFKATELLKSFKIFAEEISLQDKDLDMLWTSLDEAEKGNISSFKIQISEIIRKQKDVR